MRDDQVAIGKPNDRGRKTEDIGERHEEEPFGKEDAGPGGKLLRPKGKRMVGRHGR